MYDMTNQRHAPAAPCTSFSLLFEISNRGTVSHFDAFYNFAFRNVLKKISISNKKKLTAQCRMCTCMAATNLGIVIKVVTVVPFLFGTNDKL